MISRAKLGVIYALMSMSVIGFIEGKKRWRWSGPLERGLGKVVSCTSRMDLDHGIVYTTEYWFKDELGASWNTRTYAIRYCLPPGSDLVVEWPKGRPDSARALEKK